ncbi:MAG: phosphoribosyl-AMP cyclohydrolase [Methylophaga sp.]|uniref:phosphoribosyl-AMP cyclohydrolase n=1 Tax=Methylophaga sp. UBA678 TaxID=1946901 RepID=UPI000C491670|nr:phosphoribosyl-AMP cyclohydrolase [Methylophaga sp. UBA678]MAX51205.1 phosphoribosyl-AMP cyclohydrolase [Methylophaga sp.]|tara:strand:- start:14689 stop:15093 length:405 start_codon:yes stop_codon:yes gene_type:complete
MIKTLENLPTGSSLALQEVIDNLPWNAQGLINAVAQQYDSGELLMVAWMNKEALLETVTSKRACYWSRSRQCLWRKGETSGHTQEVKSIFLDCDGDAVLLKVDQKGAACHTGRKSCFYNQIIDDRVVVVNDKVN